MTTNLSWNSYCKMLSTVPRDYQVEAVKAWLGNNCRGVFQMATGTGKTFTAIAAMGFLAQKIMEKKRSVLTVIVCPYIHVVDQWVQNLSSQNIDSLAAYESRESWESALNNRIRKIQAVPGNSSTVVTTIATYRGKAFQKIISGIMGFDLIFVADEVHHFGAENLASSLQGKAKYRLGLSATPERYLDPKGTERLFKYFGDPVYKLDLKSAIEKGILCEYEYIPKICKLTIDETLTYSFISEEIGIILRGREFWELSKAESEKVGKLLRLRSAVLGTCSSKQQQFAKDFKSNAHLKYQLVYCSQGGSPIDEDMGRHIEYVEELVKKTGVRVATYEATTKRQDRVRILEEFQAQKIDVILSMKCLDEAVDIPAAQTSYFLASGTNPREFVQRRGRILRRSPGKDRAKIYDYIAVPADIGNPDFIEFEKSIIARELDRAYELADASLNPIEARKHLEEVKIGE